MAAHDAPPRHRLPARRGGPATDAGAPPLPDVLQFMQLLWAIVHGLQKTSKRMTQRLGVTGPQRLVLRVVGLFPGTSAGSLASILHVHPSTLTGVLQRLIDQGLLKRSADPADARRSVLHLTARGARVNGTTSGTVESAVRRVLASTVAADRAATKRVLAALALALGLPPRSVRSPLPRPASPEGDGRPRTRGDQRPRRPRAWHPTTAT